MSFHRKSAMESISNSRLYFLDWLRVIAFALLVFYHTGLIFVTWGFHISNDSFSEDLKLPMLFVNQWRLPLLFFISGAGIYFALGKRTVSMFARERFTRIFIPLVFGVFIIIPPQLFFEWKQAEVFKGSYWEFYPLFFQHITWNHLWFLVYLFVFTFLALPLFIFLRTPAGTYLAKMLATLLSRKNCLLLIVLPLFVVEITLRPRWPDNRNLVTDWYNFSFYFLTMIYGYFFGSSHILWEHLEKTRRINLAIGALTFGLIYFGWHQPGLNFLETFSAGKFIFDFAKCLNILAWIFCFAGYARRYLNSNSSALAYTNKAVYPFFILHQTVLIFIGFFIVEFDWSIYAKFSGIVLGTFLVTLLIYEFVLRRIRGIGVFFGISQPAALPNSQNPKYV
jgi:hypothetical protein